MKLMVSSSFSGFSPAFGSFEGGPVRSVRQHTVVEGYAAQDEALRLGVVDAEEVAHELRHDVPVYQGGRNECSATIQQSRNSTKSMFPVGPTRRPARTSTLTRSGCPSG